MPTKALVASAYAARLARTASAYGLSFDGPLRVDMAKVMQRAHQVTLNARTNNENWLEGMKGCTLVRGHARFEGPKTIRVGQELLTAPKIFLNVGGRAVIPDFPGIDAVAYLTNSSIVMLDQLPRHLIIVGGSYIGLEFAQIYRRLGADVTVVEKGDRLVGREDPDISEEIADILRGEELGRAHV